MKGQVLETLEKNKGAFVSGNELAERLYVSRNAVWKAIKALKEDGHQISAITNKGYCLATDSAVLSTSSIEKHLGPLNGLFDIAVYKTLASTSTTLKEQASKGAREGTVIVAEAQSGGRGRQGRDFFSPTGAGVYFSLLLRPSVTASDATLITTAAAVAVAEAIEALTGVEAKIKWVNDVFCNGKKVSGILTEGAFDMESGGMEYVVLGIGVNITKPEEGYPEELRNVATAICEVQESVPDVRSRLIADILKRFLGYYQQLTGKVYLKAYKSRSFIVGYDVDVVSGNTSRRAQVLEIDDDCCLIVKFEDGSVETLSSGEVSIRPRVL